MTFKPSAFREFSGCGNYSEYGPDQICTCGTKITLPCLRSFDNVFAPFRVSDFVASASRRGGLQRHENLRNLRRNVGATVENWICSPSLIREWIRFGEMTGESPPGIAELLSFLRELSAGLVFVFGELVSICNLSLRKQN